MDSAHRLSRQELSVKLRNSVAPLTSTEENVLREGKAAIKAVANCLVDRDYPQ